MPCLCIVVTTISKPVKLVPVAELSLARPSGCPELVGGRGRPFLTGDMYCICILYSLFVFAFVFIVVFVVVIVVIYVFVFVFVFVVVFQALFLIVFVVVVFLTGTSTQFHQIQILFFSLPRLYLLHICFIDRACDSQLKYMGQRAHYGSAWQN